MVSSHHTILRENGSRIPVGAATVSESCNEKGARDIIKTNLGRKVEELGLSSKMPQADLADEAEIRRA